MLTTFSDIEKYLAEKDDKINEEVSSMGDKDYIPWSERLIAEGMSQGLSQGLSQGKMDEIFCSVYEKDYSLSRGAEKLNISEEEFSERYEKWKKEQQL